MCAVRDMRTVLAGVPNPTVVEVGAFEGKDTLTYALAAGKVFSFEGGPSKVAGINRRVDLLRSIARDHGIAIADVTVIGKAVSDRKGTALFNLPWGNTDMDSLGPRMSLVANENGGRAAELRVESA